MNQPAGMLQRLDNTTLGDRASAALLEHIRSQQLKPGTALPSEAKLTELLGVSRPVVREALRNLRGLGVIEILNGRGAIVGELNRASLEVFFVHALQTTSNSVIELMELRMGLECEAAALAATRHKAADAAAMESLLSQMRATIGDAQNYAQLDASLHVAIARASGNTLYEHMVQSIRTAMEDASLKGMQRRVNLEEIDAVQRMHEMIVGAILRRDADAAFREMKQHMVMATRALERKP